MEEKYIWDLTKIFKDITYSDIVILLRSIKTKEKSKNFKIK